MEVLNISKQEVEINEEIRDKEIRLINSDGSPLGIMSAKDAQAMANTKNLDLVKIAPQATPPVCKIMDYGKYLFEQQKRVREARKNQKTVEQKEIWLSAQINDHDLGFKAKNAEKFLLEGDKVKASIKFRGREMQYTSSGEKIMLKFAEILKDCSTIERKPKLEGRNMIMILNPTTK